MKNVSAMWKSLVVWWATILPGWRCVHSQITRRRLVLGVGALVLGCIAVEYGVGWAQQHALYPGDTLALWRITQANTA